jgi:hypothetical protein
MSMELNWTKGKNLGLAMIIFSLSLFYQIIIISIAEYAYLIGSPVVMVLIPLGATIAIAYSVSMIFTGNLTGEIYAKLQTGLGTKENSKRILYPYLIVIGIFSALLFLTYYIAVEKLSPLSSLVIGENLASIVTLIISDKLRNDAKKRR